MNVKKKIVPAKFWQIFNLNPPIIMGELGGAETMRESNNLVALDLRH